ncbi:hypothetical protein C8R43DRAFT_1203486 [Mycena crocata]|nr:hypothetical protein C8R43DRAFT_1203486 [Mycena crocata]
MPIVVGNIRGLSGRILVRSKRMDCDLDAADVSCLVRVNIDVTPSCLLPSPSDFPPSFNCVPSSFEWFNGSQEGMATAAILEPPVLPLDLERERFLSWQRTLNRLRFRDDPGCFSLSYALAPIFLPLQRLDCGLGDLFNGISRMDFTHTLFSHLIHLRYFGHVGIPDSWSGLALIPILSYLAFYHKEFIPLFLGLLDTCNALRILMHLNFGRVSGQLRDVDERLAEDPLFLSISAPSYVEDWLSGARTDINFWTKAEAFVKHRKSGHVPGPSLRRRGLGHSGTFQFHHSQFAHAQQSAAVVGKIFQSIAFPANIPAEPVSHINRNPTGKIQLNLLHGLQQDPHRSTERDPQRSAIDVEASRDWHLRETSR